MGRLSHAKIALMLLGVVVFVLVILQPGLQPTWLRALYTHVPEVSSPPALNTDSHTSVALSRQNKAADGTSVATVYSRTMTHWTNANVCENMNLTALRKTVLRTPGGETTIFIYDPAVDIYISAGILRTGRFEPEICDVVLRQLKESPGAVLLDVGANIGAITLTAAKMGRRVIAIDALAINVKRICASVTTGAYTDNVTIIHNAVSYSRGIVTMRENTNNVGGSFINENNDLKKSFFEPKELGATMASVVSIRLDDILDIPGLELKDVVMKMDVEGYERQALIGADRLFSGGYIHSIVIEWLIVGRDPKSNEIISFLDNYNMKPYTINRQALNTSNWQKWPKDVLWLRKT